MAGSTQTQTAGRKRAAHLGPERRRPQVLDAALKLFLDGGYEGTSMDAVARAAGVTKPVVYACFESKDDLFRSLLAREEETILAEVEGAFEEDDLADPETTLTNGFTGFLTAVDKRPEVYRLIFFGEGGGNAAVAERVQAGRAQQVEALSGLARTWLEAQPGSASKTSVIANSRLMGHMLDGLAESGARLLLSGADGWTPASLGRQLGRTAATALRSI